MAPARLAVYIRGVRTEADEGEKIELSLEQRQVAILAGFALLLLGVVFALGVMVGRQLASAALVAPVQPPVGDLRALDAEKPPPAVKPIVAVPTNLLPAPPHATPTPAPAHDAKPTVAEKQNGDDSAKEHVAVAAPAEVAVVAAPAKAVAVAAPKDAEAPLPPLPEHLGRYTVQFGATQDRKDAQRLEARAQAQGLKPSYIVVAHLGAKGTWYRLRAGAFDDRDEALKYQKDIDRELHVHSAVMSTN